MVYVGDVVAAFVSALDTALPGARVYALQGETASTGRIVECIRAIVPGALIGACGAPMPIAERLAEDDLRACLPGLPHTPLEAGIETTIDVYRRWLSR
jgi:nucleoside-diphosphate-sugar epimerase